MYERSDDKHPLVLVVDDDPSMRLLARAAIEALGFEAMEAEDGQDAVELLEGLSPDLVVLDILMPRMDGFQACAELRMRKHSQHLPVLIMTGLTDVESIQAAFEAGATDFITKPINWTVFAHRVRYMVRAGRSVTELASARNAAEAATRVKSEFIANMSHEIRTPLNAVLGYIDLLRDGDLSPEERLSYLETVDSNGRHLLEVVSEILDFSKLEARNMQVERIPLSPIQLVSGVAALMSARAAEKGLDFRVEYRGKIPEVIQSDPVRLRQILLNLLGNAIKFTEAGGVRAVVSLPEPGEHTLGKLCFQITDTGIGIAPQDRQRLFESFVQLDTSTTRRFGGTGLGLAISQRLCACLGGKIGVESTPGRGSVFSFEIDTGPLHGVRMLESPEEAGIEPPASAVGASACLEGRVLLAEDGVDNRRLLAVVLRKAGAQLEVAENGRVAVNKVLVAKDAGEPFDAIVMDIQMPVLDGLAAASTLRAGGYFGPLIALTADAQELTRRRCFAAGFDDFLTKPVERAQLLALLDSYLSKSRLPS
jgi:signal transduction histidine kinase